MTRAKKVWISSIVVLLIFLILAAMLLVPERIKISKAEMESLMQQELGFKVNVSDIRSRWSGVSLAVTIKDVRIYDQNEAKESIPFVAIDTLELRPKLMPLLLKQALDYDRITLLGLKLVAGWNDDKPLSLLGLNGDYLPGAIDLKPLLNILSGKEVILKQGEIRWVKGKNVLVQDLNGLFESIREQSTRDRSTRDQSMKDQSTKDRKLKFTGTEQLTIGRLAKKTESQKSSKSEVQKTPKSEAETSPNSVPLLELDTQSLEFFPEAPIKFSINVDTGYANLTTELFQVKLDCSFDRDSHPNLNCMALGSLEQGLEFIQHTPLKSSVGEILESLDPVGPMSVNLSADLPSQTGAAKQTVEREANEKQPKETSDAKSKSYKSNSKTKESEKKTLIEGIVKTENARITIPELDVPITNLNGEFHFTEEEVNAKNIQGKILGRDFLGKLSPEKISVTGLITASELQKQLQMPLLKHFTGQSTFAISRYNDNSRWQIESDLVGMKVDLPAPLGKSEDSKSNIDITIFPLQNGERRVSFQIGKVLDAKWVAISKGGKQQFKRVHLALGGKADWTSQESFLVSGNIANLDVNEWWKFLEKQDGDLSRQPINVHFLVDNLQLFGLAFKKTWIDFQSSSQKLEWQVDGPNLKGSLVLGKNEVHAANKVNQAGKANLETQAKSKKSQYSQINIDLERLKIEPLDIKEETASEFLSKGADIPVWFRCRDLRFDDRFFGEVSFRLQPRKDGYEISDASAKSENYSLEASGQWLFGNKGAHTVLVGNIYSDHMGRAFRDWGITAAIQDAKGRITFNLNWDSSPFQFSLAKANGSAAINLRNGSILGVNPGIGRMLGFLSLENLPRRLQLDFSDLSKRGFIFETLKSTLYFEGGFARTDDLKVDGPVASIALAGRANLSNKELDFNMSVSPKVGDTLPLAAGIATANPAVGLGVFLVGKVVGSQMGPISRYNYHVTGTWENPHLQSVSGGGGERGGKRPGSNR